MADSSRYPLTMPIESSTLTPGSPRELPLLGRAGVALGVFLIMAGFAASPAAASTVIYNGIAADGHVAFFSTEEALVPGDTDNERDVYERSYDEALERYVTREVSIGPVGGNDALPVQYDAVSADGNQVFFATKEPLVGIDTDHRTDIYRRELSTNTTTLVSRGEASCESKGCGSGAFDTSFAPGGLTADGEELFFVTDEKLSAADEDGSPDIYVRDLGAGTTALVSEGSAGCQEEGCGNEAFGVSFNAVSADGSAAVFSSNESLSEEDEDELQDLYVRDLEGGATQLVSTPGSCPGSVDCKAVYGGIAADGSHVFFESSEQISEEDEDESQDVYDWTSGGGAALASIGPEGGNGAPNATFARSSADGGAVFFETSEQLTATDEDSSQDVYQRSVGVTTLVSTGPEGGNGAFNASLRWVSPDGSSAAAFFSTAEQLTSADKDSSVDVYQRSVGVTTLVSTGPEGGNGPPDALFAGASHDGSRVFFITLEKLVGEDTDSSSDIYQRYEGATTLISTGPEGGNGAFGSGLPENGKGVSKEGGRVFFTTDERLTEGDPDAETDIYERSASTTRLVSVGNLLALGPVAPTLTATNPKSPSTSTTPSILGQAEPETWIKLYATFDCSGEPVAQGTVEELAGAGLAVTVAEGSTTSFRATAEAEGLVSPCSGPISYKQETPPPPPPPGEEEKGPGGGGTPTGSGGGGSGEKTHNGGIAYVAPETLITFGPASKTKKRKVVFRFSDGTGQPGTSFSCKVDRQRWKACSSPMRVAKLARGRHVFAVKSVNAVGTWDSQPAKRAFKVVR
ncbi:MAG TPA: hypothetical protein VIE64_06655 [Solirubrobacterales bacterium]|jgi:hypothetical protein